MSFVIAYTLFMLLVMFAYVIQYLGIISLNQSRIIIMIICNYIHYYVLLNCCEEYIKLYLVTNDILLSCSKYGFYIFVYIYMNFKLFQCFI